MDAIKQIGLVILLVVLGGGLVAASGSDAVEPKFVALGDLPDGSVNSCAQAVSADGSVIVGYGIGADGMEAFCWTRKSGIEGLGFVSAAGISADGQTAVGYRLGSTAEAVRCGLRGQVVPLGMLPNCNDSEAIAISADGSVVVGHSGSDYDEQAFRWNEREGVVGLGYLPGGEVSEAYAVAADGSVIVGYSGLSDGRREAFRWTKASGMVGLGALAGDRESVANAVSADGAVVVGWSGYAQAFRWTKHDGMVGLGGLAGGSPFSMANGVSSDGTIVVGTSFGVSGMQAFVWDSEHGMRNLYELLKKDLGSHRHVLDGWKLTVANAISADGQVIVGYGTNPRGDHEAWLASITHSESHRLSSR